MSSSAASFPRVEITTSTSTFRELIEAALPVIRAAAPRFYDDMITSLADRAVDLQVDDESLRLVVLEDRVTVRDGTRAPWITTTGETILSLLDAEASLVEVMRDNRLRIRGTAPQLVTFHGALMAFLEGCVRAPGMSARVSKYRAHVARTNQAGVARSKREQTR